MPHRSALTALLRMAAKKKALKLQQVREYRRMLVKEHEELYEAAISDTNKSMCGAFV
jgi:hypothetical protein